jgi:aminoglycoside phosphotransferase (APT) family kinase protein
MAPKLPQLQAPFTWDRLAGGHSNLTFAVQDGAGRRVVVRRPPVGELKPGAHDMDREYRIISGLWGARVPVPEPLAYCEDRSITGSPFYVMAHVNGRVTSDASSMREWLPADDLQRRAADSFADSLADLHALPADTVHFEGSRRPEDFVARQLRAWYRSWTLSADDAGIDDARAHELHGLLEGTIPEPGPLVIVHGDYGFHNCLLGADGSVTAIVDWEVCTQGDARFDVAYAFNRWSTEADPVPGREDVTMPAAFPSAEEFLDRYRARSGVTLDGLDYFVTLNHWRSACILQGVLARYRAGQKSAAGVDLAHFEAGVRYRLDAAVQAAQETRP